MPLCKSTDGDKKWNPCKREKPDGSGCDLVAQKRDVLVEADY